MVALSSPTKHLFEICSPVDVLLISMKLKHRETVFRRLLLHFFLGFFAYIGFHNKHPVCYTVLHINELQFTSVTPSLCKPDCSKILVDIIALLLLCLLLLYSTTHAFLSICVIGMEHVEMSNKQPISYLLAWDPYWMTFHVRVYSRTPYPRIRYPRFQLSADSISAVCYPRFTVARKY